MHSEKLLANQVQPFSIPTRDGETLYAWHVMPVAKYTANEESLLNDSDSVNFTDTAAFTFLAKDPSSRLVINFHGNAGTVAQGWRTDTYRTLSSGAADKIHVLAFDYRGFGYSTGSPDEQGLITDGVAAVEWALDVAHIPPERIVLVGQSLGTAVAAAAAEYFARTSHTEFAGVVLIAPFSDVRTLLLTYSIKGFLPVLSPLKPYPALQNFFLRYVKDTWETSSRIVSLIHMSQQVNLHMIHSKDDPDIFWKHSEALFYAAANATSPSGMSPQQVDAVKFRQDLAEGGAIESWNADGTKKISKQILRYGGSRLSIRLIENLLIAVLGHNRIATYPCVAQTVQKMFGL
ncbi:MAG: hypothetical protein L6R35_004208 [Caloplaca aegaea]|nr:MAG: hypothetical protein L6R35_004208 [Caloplaca aegaea]